jgi:hypothetical protein
MIAGHGNQRRELEFAPDSTALDPVQSAMLDRMAASVARVAAWRHDEGLPPPRVDLTVESVRRERGLAGARGEVVKTYFLGCLRTRLAGLDRPDAAADIEVTVHRGHNLRQRIWDRGGDGAAEGRSAVVLTYVAENDPDGDVGAWKPPASPVKH